jgi:hypothetical protein
VSAARRPGLTVSVAPRIVDRDMKTTSRLLSLGVVILALPGLPGASAS